MIAGMADRSSGRTKRSCITISGRVIDLAFRGEQGRLKYEFRLAPGRIPRSIRLAYDGAESLSLSPDGALLLGTSLGELRDEAPLTYQVVAGKRVAVASGYQLDDTSYGFELAAYDRERPLVIDRVSSTRPTWAGARTTLASTSRRLGRKRLRHRPGHVDRLPNIARSLRRDARGPERRVRDEARSDRLDRRVLELPGRQRHRRGRGHRRRLRWPRLLTGWSTSTDFPTSADAVDTTRTGLEDVFVTVLDASGAIDYSTYLGGGGQDQGFAIASDGSGGAYVTGVTVSSDFPTTAGAFDLTASAFGDAFVTKLDAGGTGSLVYSSYLGGSLGAFGQGIAVDPEGNAYVTGRTQSADFPATAGAFDTSQNGGDDAFVTVLNAAGSSLVYSTFLGGGGGDLALAIAVNAAGEAYVAGMSDSSFPTTPGAFDSTSDINGDAFVARLDATGSGLVFATLLGGNFRDSGQGIDVDAAATCT